MNAKAEFARLLKAHRITNFSVDEVFFMGAGHGNPRHRGYGLNTEPPKYLWKHIWTTLTVAQMVRDHFGPTVLTSIYRSPAYNRAVGSSNPANPRVLTGPGSFHPRFNAVDLQVRGVFVRRVYDFLLAERRRGTWTGGLGLYRNFVHIDTRPTNATWGG